MSEKEIRHAIRDRLTSIVSDPFTDDEDLLARGAIRSLDVLELVDYVADRFAVTVTTGDLYNGLLNTVDGLVRLVAERVTS
jgi:acyl carrier protein